MARMTKAQREWRPGMKKKRRSVRIMFASTVLCLEALVFLFATMSIVGLHGDTYGEALIWSVGLALAVIAVLDCALLRKPVGFWIGWALQLVLILAGFLDYFMFVIGVLFAVCWWYAVTKGLEMDEENKRRDAAQAEWEAQHGSD